MNNNLMDVISKKYSGHRNPIKSFARDAGMSYYTARNWVHKDTSPRYSFLEKLSSSLGIPEQSVCQVLYGDGKDVSALIDDLYANHYKLKMAAKEMDVPVGTLLTLVSCRGRMPSSRNIHKLNSYFKNSNRQKNIELKIHKKEPEKMRATTKALIFILTVAAVYASLDRLFLQ